MAMKSSRKAAIAARERFYYTGKPCLRGHLSERLTVTGACVECARQAIRDVRRQLRQSLSA